MITLKNIRNYFFYCGLEKDDYNVLKKDAYVSNLIGDKSNGDNQNYR